MYTVYSHVCMRVTFIFFTVKRCLSQLKKRESPEIGQFFFAINIYSFTLIKTRTQPKVHEAYIDGAKEFPRHFLGFEQDNFVNGLVLVLLLAGPKNENPFQ